VSFDACWPASYVEKGTENDVVLRRRKTRNTNTNLARNPGGKISLEESRTRWEDDSQVTLNEIVYTSLARGRVQWLVLVKRILDLPVPRSSCVCVCVCVYESF
jgi:hypothetical protein